MSGTDLVYATTRTNASRPPLVTGLPPSILVQIPITLCSSYAMSGALFYHPMCLLRDNHMPQCAGYALAGTDLVHTSVVLCACYAMSGTDLAYGTLAAYASAPRCPVLTKCMDVPVLLRISAYSCAKRCPLKRWHSSLHRPRGELCYALPGTGLAYGARLERLLCDAHGTDLAYTTFAYAIAGTAQACLCARYAMPGTDKGYHATGRSGPQLRVWYSASQPSLGQAYLAKFCRAHHPPWKSRSVRRTSSSSSSSLSPSSFVPRAAYFFLRGQGSELMACEVQGSGLTLSGFRALRAQTSQFMVHV
eukprot:977415-Rhodomonas_salina.4